MAHEHTEMTEAEMADLLKRLTARAGAAVDAAKARDPQVCVRCVNLGLIVGQIMWVEAVMDDGADLPELHATLQMLYAAREAYLNHSLPVPVVQ